MRPANRHPAHPRIVQRQRPLRLPHSVLVGAMMTCEQAICGVVIRSIQELTPSIEKATETAGRHRKGDIGQKNRAARHPTPSD
jgi:hypothetical protein